MYHGKMDAVLGRDGMMAHRRESMGWMSVNLLNHTLSQHINGDFSMQHFIGNPRFIGEDTEVSSLVADPLPTKP